MKFPTSILYNYNVIVDENPLHQYYILITLYNVIFVENHINIT